MKSRGYVNRGAVAAVLLPVVLGGCALPLPLKIASWAIDGISYVATHKSVTDHGISMAMKKDCALLRGVTEGEVCRQDSEFQIALVNPKTGEAEVVLKPEAEGLAETADESEELADFETASSEAADGKTEETVVEVAAVEAEAPVEAAEPVAAKPVAAKPAVAKPAVAETAAAEAAPSVDPAEMIASVGRTAIAALKEGANLFYVIGSFSSPDRAQVLASRHETLEPSVMPVKVRKKEVYRVLVGPFTKDEMRDAGKRLHTHGLKHAWGVRIDPADWQSVRLTPNSKPPVSDDSFSVAALPE